MPTRYQMQERGRGGGDKRGRDGKSIFSAFAQTRAEEQKQRDELDRDMGFSGAILFQTRPNDLAATAAPPSQLLNPLIMQTQPPTTSLHPRSLDAPCARPPHHRCFPPFDLRPKAPCAPPFEMQTTASVPPLLPFSPPPPPPPPPPPLPSPPPPPSPPPFLPPPRPPTYPPPPPASPWPPHPPTAAQLRGGPAAAWRLLNMLPTTYVDEDELERSAMGSSS